MFRSRVSRMLVVLLLLVSSAVDWPVHAAGPDPGASTYETAVLADNPLVYWRLTDATGGPAPSGGVKPDPPGLRFDGVSGSASGSLDLSGTTAVTLEFWLEWDRWADDDHLAFELSGSDQTFHTTDGFLVNPDSSFWPGRFEVSLGGATNYNAALLERPTAGVWHHYAIVLDRAAPPDQQITPYVDGVPAVYRKPTGYSNRPQPGHEHFGNDTLFLMSRFGKQLFGSGALARVAVYPVALSGQAIRQHYLAADPTSGDIHPSLISRATADIANPWRGPSLWDDTAAGPAGQPATDSYMRYTWRDLEPSPGQYDFSAIDRKLAQANARGGKFGFRVMSAASSQGALVPQYVMDKMPKGFWFAAGGGKPDTYVPDWNSSVYLDRVDALLAALHSAYADDPRLGWVDVGLYGDFGEWHLYGFPYGPSPTGATPISAANAHRIIDSHVHAFPRQRLIVQTANEDALSYALNLSPRIGWRSDCLGEPSMAGLLENASVLSLVHDRWRTAPVLAEYCYAAAGSGYVQHAASQVSDLHIAMVSTGNLQPWEAYASTEQNAIAEADTMAGYRFVLDEVTLPGSVRAGDSVPITSRWSNAGVAPAYSAWQVVFQLRDHQSDGVAWQAISQLDLQTLMPSGDPESGSDSPQTIEDVFSLPASLPAGTYDLAVLIKDADGYYDPLALAIDGRQADGSYGLGTLTVEDPSTSE